MNKSIEYGRRGARLARPERGGYFAVSDEFGTQPVGMDRRPERPTCSTPGPKLDSFSANQRSPLSKSNPTQETGSGPGPSPGRKGSMPGNRVKSVQPPLFVH